MCWCAWRIPFVVVDPLVLSDVVDAPRLCRQGERF
jgi:hypothetical protein